MDNYKDFEEPKKGFTVGKLIKWIFIIVVIFIYAALIVRCTLSRDDKLVKKIIVNDATEYAYTMNKDIFSVDKYPMNSPWVAISEGRLVEFNNLYYIPLSKQLQFSVKYNTDIAQEIGKDGIPFRFKLVDEENNIYESYFFEQNKKYRFNYIRVCFDGIELVRDEINIETNRPLRKKYYLYIDRLENGLYKELCHYMIYDGTEISKKIAFNARIFE